MASSIAHRKARKSLAARTPGNLSDDLAGGEVQRRKQRRSPMSAVVVRALPGHPRHHRQDRLRAIDGLNLPFLLHARHQRPIGQVQIQSHEIARLLENSGSVERLKVFARCGRRPKACQRRTTAVCDSPLALAILQRLQCVASRGFSCSVLAITGAIWLSLIVRGAPGRGSAQFPCGLRRDAQLPGNILVGPIPLTGRHDPRSHRQRPRGLLPPSAFQQPLVLFRDQHDRPRSWITPHRCCLEIQSAFGHRGRVNLQRINASGH